MVWCDTELTTNTRTIKEKTATVEKLHATVDELDASMNNLAMEVAELSAQLSRLRKEVFSATSMRHEETATNEEAIKDVQDAQSSLTQAVQILTDFYAKTYNGNQVGRYQCHQLPPGDSERLREARVGDHSGRVRSDSHF